MIPEIGNIFLIISFVLAVSIFCLASYSYYLNREIINLSNLVYFKFVSILMSFIALEISFLSDDFSVLYVASNSNPFFANLLQVFSLMGRT